MTTQMSAEIQQIPEVTERLLTQSGPVVARAAAGLRAQHPVAVLTIARGSSDHAATYLKYAYEIALGIPVASIGPSIGSIYRPHLQLANMCALAISQSGQSPDIVEMTALAGKSGAHTIAITNAEASPLGDTADMTLPLNAGTEASVAATKTFVSTVVTGLLLGAHWAQDEDLLAALHELPKQFEQAINCDWTGLGAALSQAPLALTLGRGPAFAIAGEAALKLKEVARIAALPYSSAEVMHGPVSIVEPGTPAVMFMAGDGAASSNGEVAAFLADAGARVFVTGKDLEVHGTDHPLTSVLPQVVSFYAMVEALGRARGLDPDKPRHLKKVTRTW